MKKIIMGSIIGLIMLGSFFLVSKYQDNERKKEEKEALSSVLEHYNKYVKTNKESTLYIKKEKEYEKIGLVSKNVELSLKEEDITSNTKYFTITSLDKEYYIKYEDVDKINELTEKNTRYKRYIPFNQNIITNEEFSFYDGGEKFYTFYESFSLPIIIKEDNCYYVEYDGHLLAVKKEDVKKIIDNHNTDLTNSSGVAVLNYHFFYDEENKEDYSTCREIICMSKKQFKEELEYFKKIDIFTPSMKELEMYLDKKINLPKSVLITIDDGGRTDIAIKLLTEYKYNATIFLITSWFDPSSYYSSEYIELHSHGNNLHNPGVCPGGQGGAIKCSPRDKLLADLKESRDKLGGSTAFAFPFYEYNDYAISVLKEAGFTMAFIGKNSKTDNLAKPGSNKFKIRRYPMLNKTSISDLEEYFSKIK